ncbi:type I-E CRISPR-associated protein Cse2/CasB [Streptomyces silvisoli]|uniref:Type I-E CRISPR-associated protein Cse2/CasB n=1 Tax=Streptomyces silvisoli TaxID=3034235 RepID=A0ABT5ZRC8_9ACTN|nr:type I-E CRISPR-associated protein Cse2/CasB [Streptomyces silvisoli]MDF3292367.1 type I-E CRISPR-associated protein Cse2/CasB [Streptomyces silvisoli]
MASAPAPPRSKRQEQFDRYDAFVAYVVDLCGRSTKAQADLRTGLGRPLERCTYMHRYLVPRLPEPKRPGWYDDARRAHYAVASLIAARPRTARDTDKAAALEAEADADAVESVPTPVVEWWRRPNLGASLAEGVNKKLLKPDTAEDDLHLLVRQGSDAVQQRLPSLTRHVLNGGVSIDWSVLLDDLAWWNVDRDRVATRWLEAYFRVRTLEDRKEEQKENH